MVVCCALAGWPVMAAEAPHLLSVKEIWRAGKHNAFTDLIRFQDKWFCTFRESEAHVGGNGSIRILESGDGEQWKSAALVTELGRDLRDPKLSITPDGRLMLVMGGSVYEGKKLMERQPRVAFSKDGSTWTAPKPVLEKGDWLWRVTWHDGRVYGISYTDSAPPGSTGKASGEWTLKFVESQDGVDFHLVTLLQVPSRPNESTVRFLTNGDCVALVRREGLGKDSDKAAWIGVSQAPYTSWQWKSAGMQVGGPDFLVLPDGSLIASGREYGPTWASSKTFVGRMDLHSVKPELGGVVSASCAKTGAVQQTSPRAKPPRRRR